MSKKTEKARIGDKYERVYYSVLTRLVGTSVWYGMTRFKTLADAQAGFKRILAGSRYEVVGGIAVDFGEDDGRRYERKLVKTVAQCEVLEVGIG